MKPGLILTIALLLPLVAGGQPLPGLETGWQYFFVTPVSYGAAGTGTQYDPFDGSTAEKFDEVMTKLVAWPGTSNRVIQLMPGTFWTRGVDFGADGWRVGEGCSNIIIRGCGQAQTTLNFTNEVLDMQRVVVRYGRAGGFPVYHCGLEDLTIDAGAHVGRVTNGCTVGAVIYGSGNYIRRVTVKNLRSSTDLEAFGLNCTRGNPEDYDNAIEDCRVLGVMDNYATGIAMVSSRSRVVNCFVDFGPPPQTKERRYTAGLTLYGSQCLAIGNVLTNAQRGIHGDGTDSSMLYANNVYVGNTVSGFFGAFTSMLGVLTNTAPRWTLDRNTIIATQPSNYWLIAWCQPALKATNTHPDWVVMNNRFTGVSTNGLWHREGYDWTYLRNQFDLEPRHVFSGHRLLVGNTNRFGGPALAPVYQVAPGYSNGLFQLTFRGDSGPSFRVENLTGFGGGSTTPLFSTNLPVLPITWTAPPNGGNPSHFYRVTTTP